MRLTVTATALLVSTFLVPNAPGQEENQPVVPVQELVEFLQSGEEVRQLRALDTLGHHGADAASASPEVRKLLSHKNAEVRRSAINTLGRIASDPESVTALAGIVKGDDELSRSQALHALGQIGPPAAMALPDVKTVVRDSQGVLYLLGVWALDRIENKPTDELQAAIPRLVEALRDANADMRNEAVVVLGEIGKPAVPALTLALADPASQIRWQAAAALAEIGPDAGSSEEALGKLLADNEERVRWHAANALGKISAQSENSLDLLCAALKDTSPMVRGHAARALGNIGKDERKVIESLADMVADENPYVRRAAVRALADIGPDPNVSMPILVKVLNSSEPQVVAQALEALAEGAAKHPDRLARALENEEARHYAAVVAGSLGPAAKPVVPALITASKDKDPAVRTEVLLALAAVGPDASAAAPRLAEMLDDDSPQVRGAALFAIASVGTADEAAQAKIAQLLDSKDEAQRRIAAYTLSRIAPDHPMVASQCVNILAMAVENGSPIEQLESCRTLGELGSKARAALPSLRKLVQHKDPEIRDAAKAAIKQIRE